MNEGALRGEDLVWMVRAGNNPAAITDTDAGQPGLSMSGSRHQHLLCLCCSDSWERGQQLFIQFL